MWNLNHVNSRILRALTCFFIDPFFIFYCFSWFLIRFTRHSGHAIPYLNNWLTDFVFVPLIVHASSIFGYFILHLKTPHRYPLSQILLLSLMVALVFEYIMPKYTSYNTADFMDVLAYLLGGLFYYYVHQQYTYKRLSRLEQESEI